MKKRSSLWVFLVLALFIFLPGTSEAQSPAPLDSVTIDLWPDFDQPELLVLITGNLPAGTALPATVDVPLPDNADLLVAARVTPDGNMIDDIVYTQNANSVTLTTTELTFRVEYYMPYTEDGNARTIEFAWLAPNLDVNQLSLQVQQPAYADFLTVTPSAIAVNDSNDGLKYHRLAPAPVPAGESYAVTASYVLDPELLSIDGLSNAVPDLGTNGGTTTAQPASDTNWLLIAGVIIGIGVLLVVVWFIATTRGQTSNRPRKPKPIRSEKSKNNASARFCHQCGTGLQASDKFCKNCGTAVKK